MTAFIPRLQGTARKYLAGVFYKHFYLRDDVVSRVINHLVPARQPPGRAVWDAEYNQGYWNKLLDLSEQAHYAVLRSYILHVTPGGEILDVGCGEGLLLQHLGRDSYGRYVGIDFSESALARCPRPRDSRTVLVAANAEEYVPQGR